MANRPSLWNALLGAAVHLVRGRRYRHRVIEAGSGEPLILVHGVGSSAEVFARNVMPLAERFHVYAVDALYHGHSSLEPYDAVNRVRTQANALLDFMNALDIRRAHMEGESMGAGMVFDLAMRHPDRSMAATFPAEFPLVVDADGFWSINEQDERVKDFPPG